MSLLQDYFYKNNEQPFYKSVKALALGRHFYK